MSFEPALIILAAWIFFGGTHIILSASKLRDITVARLGSRGFTITYALVTTLSLGLLIMATAVYGDQGHAGFVIPKHSIVVSALNSLSFIGVFLVIAGLLDYPTSPMATLAQRQRENENTNERPLAPPTSLARFTRHPFFFGLALVMTAQTLRAPTLASAFYYGGFVTLSLLGIYFQDRKLKARAPKAYGTYMANTQALPKVKRFKFQVSKTDKIKWSIALILTLLALTLLRPIWTYANGAVMGILILVFGILATVFGLIKSARYSNR